MIALEKKTGCRKVGNAFKIRKTAASNISQNKQKIYETAVQRVSRKYKLPSSRPGKYKIIKNILYEWHQRFFSSDFYPNSPPTQIPTVGTM